MKPEQLKYGIALTLIDGIGNNLAKNLIAFLGNEEAVFREKPGTLAKIPGIGTKLARRIAQQKHVLKRAEEEVGYILKHNIRCYYYAGKDYPFRLKECPDAPLILYTKSACGLNDARIIGVVGTRNATEYGRSVCRNFISSLTSVPNLVIVSGLAYGIDICAHKSALESDIPTLGVIAHGLDRIYPPAHRTVASGMCEKGGLVTEYISGTNPDRQNFVQRNRIIAGLSDAIVVIESACKGGALITAGFANDYNRDVFAFPGRMDDEWSRGCNMLIKNNRAGLIESAEDMLKMMGWEKGQVQKTMPRLDLFTELTEEEMKVFTCLRTYPDGIHVNLLAVTLAFPYSKLTAVLLEMEFKMYVKSLPGNVYKAILPL